MSKREQPFIPRADRKQPQVRRSHYSFSKKYPNRQFEIETKTRKKKDAGHVLRICISVFCFVLLVSAAFFATDILLRISEKPDATREDSLTPNVSTELSDVRALSVSYEVLESKRSVKACIRRLKRNDCNAVVVDFKTASGLLTYSSAELLAIQANCNLYETPAARDALALFQKADMQVFAGVHCFRDPRIAAYDPEIAVKYLDTDVSWLDAPEENGGVPWVNPYATKGRAYLKAVIAEISALGVNGIVLQDLAFPAGDAANAATFPGEETGVKRNKLLKNLIHSIKAGLPDDCALILRVDALDIPGSRERFGGSIFPNECDGVLCNTANRPAEVLLNEEENYVSAINLYHSLVSEADAASFWLEIPKNEAKSAYLRAVSRNGYASYVIDE